MRLIRWQDRERLGISVSKIESPFFAKTKVQEAFHGRAFSRIEGLDVHSYGRAWSQEEILKAVEKAELLLVSNNPFSPLSDDTRGMYSHITGKSWSTGGSRKPAAQEKPLLPDAEPIVKPQPQEPGFYVVPKSTTAEKLESTLFTSKNPAVIHKFKSLNPNLNDVKAGTMIVLGDPDNLQCTREEALLMEAAAKTHEALKPLSPEEADFMVRHRDEIETFLSAGSTGIGIGEAMFSRHLESVKTVLTEIEALHTRTFQADGHLRSPAFFAERKHLLAQLNTNLTTMTRKGIGFPDHPNLKSALGISSRSVVHRWTKAGAAGQIPGYATHINGVSQAAKAVQYGGWIGITLGGGASYFKVQDVCTAGNTEACKKVKFTEVGSFAGGIAGGATAGALLSGSMVTGLCVGLGVPTGGLATLACGVVAVGVGSFAGGALGGLGGEIIGDVIYESVK